MVLPIVTVQNMTANLAAGAAAAAAAAEQEEEETHTSLTRRLLVLFVHSHHGICHHD
jgi:hypothetical protein